MQARHWKPWISLSHRGWFQLRRKLRKSELKARALHLNTMVIRGYAPVGISGDFYLAIG
jgi:hypothetical protein